MNFLFVLAALGVGSGVRGQVPGAVPTTSFTCRDRPPGYYADTETGCKTYHVCDGVSHFTYVCPRRTLFRESSRICDYSHLVRCGEEEDSLIRLAETNQKLEESKENDNITEDQPKTSTTTETTTRITESPTTFFTTTQPIATTQKPPEPTNQAIQNFLKFRVKNLRALFFIPELNNSIAAEPERELVVPLEKDTILRFKNKRKAPGPIYSACPGYCNPRFFLPGTCHPCIMIK